MSWLTKFKLLHKTSIYEIMKKKKGAFIVLATVIGSSYIMHTQVMPFNLIASLSDYKKSNTEEPTYIYLPENISGIHLDDINDSHEVSFWVPFESHKKHLYLLLLKLTKSKDPKVRHSAVKQLARISNLDESQYRMIAQACDLTTAVGIARTLNATSKLFLPPPPSLLHGRSKETIEAGFQRLFEVLPISDTNRCADYLTVIAQRSLCLRPMNTDLHMPDAVSVADGNVYDLTQRRNINIILVKKYLDALLAHSTIPQHRNIMVKNGVLILLHKVLQKYQTSIEVKSSIGQIIGNIALDKSQHASLFASGWIGILASWLNTTDIAVNLPACRALSNMDLDYEDAVCLEDGLYLLFPHFRKDRNQEINADIIFIHGLMGGAFRTWRQHDGQQIPAKVHDKDSSNSIKEHQMHDVTTSEYTYCWPKDWLAEDFPQFRLIAIDYSSHVSEWKTKCPVEKEKRDLKSRSRDTLRKLVVAGVGKRPIVWVSHSMGGILVKQMLLDAAASTDSSVKSVVQNTTGVVFYSVPHKGAEVASMSQSAMILVHPSIEAQQLKKGCPDLLKMHENFKLLAKEQNISVLSFGETLQSKIGLHWKSVLVPSDSSNPGIGAFYELPEAHLSTCKPSTKNSTSYALLVKFLSDVLPSPKSVRQAANKHELGIFIISGITD